MLLMDGMFWSKVKKGSYFTRKNLGKRKVYKKPQYAINYGLINVIFSRLCLCISKTTSHRNYVAVKLSLFLFWSYYLNWRNKIHYREGAKCNQLWSNEWHKACRYFFLYNREGKIPKGIILLSDRNKLYFTPIGRSGLLSKHTSTDKFSLNQAQGYVPKLERKIPNVAILFSIFTML